MKCEVAEYVALCDVCQRTDRSLPYAEFSYNNSYQASIKMSPFQALYGRRCRTPLHWDQPGEKQLFGPEIIEDAQTRQKSCADHRWRDLEFAVADYVYLKVSSIRGLRRFKKCLRIPEEQLQVDELNVHDDLTYTEYPVQILEAAKRTTRNRVIKMCKVKWSHHMAEEATWEREDDLRADYLELFASQSKNLKARFL
ncbi:hypothetical protein U9M48_013041 [Paspalum notatum var. saurae]|uniref:Chromo domain-containing protein n=1 Tax=Paspalum notatum var. saurae TaxID=547442 RepID=A0AAQ3T0V2_PASNO